LTELTFLGAAGTHRSQGKEWFCRPRSVPIEIDVSGQSRQQSRAILARDRVRL